jgi:hypothetical protein
MGSGIEIKPATIENNKKNRKYHHNSPREADPPPIIRSRNWLVDSHKIGSDIGVIEWQDNGEVQSRLSGY